MNASTTPPNLDSIDSAADVLVANLLSSGGDEASVTEHVATILDREMYPAFILARALTFTYSSGIARPTVSSEPRDAPAAADD